MSHAVTLTPELQHFAEEQVRAGHFESVDQVARAAFALLRENAERRESVRGELSRLFDEMDAGRAIPTTDVEFARVVKDRAAKYGAE